MTRRTARLALLGSLLASTAFASPIAWQGYDDLVFERAARDGKLVLLDVGAVWCHWCHVMEETTYRDPEVVTLVGAHFLAVKVDQDARPDLANRYEDYGWPATVIFDATGRELVKFQGYIPPPRMRSLLAGVVADPTPGPSVTQAPAVPTAAGSPGALDDALRHELEALVVERYDPEHGGWGFVKKYVDWDSVEHAMRQAARCDAAAEQRARQTLDAGLALVDPVWGGVYQYSHGGNWQNPHFEKIMPMQAENLRLYAQAWATWRDPRYLAAAHSTLRYMRTFLRSPDGAFYASQDADLVPGQHAGDYFARDDAGRRALGIPRVDTHRYARETSWAAHALATYAALTGDASALDDALAAARFVLRERALPGGGFSHDTEDAAGPYLGDSVAAGRAFLALYAATGDRAWLQHAEAAAGFVGATFRRDGGPGFVTAVQSGPLPALPQRDENVAVARFGNLLSCYTGRPEHRALRDHALSYLALPDVARRFSSASVLLADLESREGPLHVTVVGPRDDPRAQALLAAALSEPTVHKRVELWDPREGPLPNADVELPRLATPAAFLCVGGRCSAPSRKPHELLARLARIAPGVPPRS